MNKIEFKELDKEQMIIAFNQLKDDYHNVFEEKESLRSTLKEIREYITSEEYFELNNNTTGSFSKDRENYFKAQGKLLEIIDKGIGEDK